MKAILLISILFTLSLTAMQKQTPDSLLTIIDLHKTSSPKKRAKVSNALSDPRMQPFFDRPYTVAHALSTSYGIKDEDRKHVIDALKRTLFESNCVNGMKELLAGGETPHLIDYQRPHDIATFGFTGVRAKYVSLLIKAVGNGHSEMVEVLLSEGDKKLNGVEKQIALVEAVKNGHEIIVKKLLAGGALADEEALHHAIVNKNVSIALALLHDKEDLGVFWRAPSFRQYLSFFLAATDEQKKELLKFAQPRPRL